MILELDIEQNKVVSWKQQAIYIEKDGTLKLVDRKGEMIQYNKALAHSLENEEDYISSRQIVLNDWIKGRKSKRNLKWFVKRLRPKYVRLAFDMRRNKKLYKFSVTKFLE